MPAGPNDTVSLLDRLPPRDRLGRALKDLRISVIDRCNFRCPYCMPKERYHEHYRFLKSHERLSFDEITRLVRLFTQLGVRKLRITGGEPLLRPQLEELIGDLTTLPGIEDVALTTNGVLLAQHAAALRAAGLGRVTVSLDTLEPELFARMAGGYGNPERGAGRHPCRADRAASSRSRSMPSYSAASTTTRCSICSRISAAAVSRCASSSTWMSATAMAGSASRCCRRRSCARSSRHAGRCEPVAGSSPSDVAQRYRFLDGAGEVGFISSVTQPFCGDCVRARLASDGVLYSCLFATSGLDLRGPLRGGADDAQLLELIRDFWRGRSDRYSELRGEQVIHGPKRIEMNHIGG